MVDEATEEFGRKLVRIVRDDTLTSCSVFGNGGSNDPVSQRLCGYDRKLVNEILALLVPEIVDETIFHLLRSIDGEDIKLVYVADSGDPCDLADLGQGELAGNYLGEDGWVESYSQARG